jgi:hypothetical protein
MPLTPFQSELGRLVASNRSVDSYLAAGAVLSHFGRPGGVLPVIPENR